MPSVFTQLEKLSEDRLNGVAFLLRVRPHPALNRLDVGRQWLLAGHVPTDQPAVDAILTGRQVGGRLIVIANVVLEIIHPAIPQQITVASRSSVDTRRALVPSARYASFGVRPRLHS